jgi:hypothetical protein
VLLPAGGGEDDARRFTLADALPGLAVRPRALAPGTPPPCATLDLAAIAHDLDLRSPSTSAAATRTPTSTGKSRPPASTQTAALVTNALSMAIGNRQPTGDTLVHSDHGV